MQKVLSVELSFPKNQTTFNYSFKKPGSRFVTSIIIQNTINDNIKIQPIKLCYDLLTLRLERKANFFKKINKYINENTVLYGLPTERKLTV